MAENCVGADLVEQLRSSNGSPVIGRVETPDSPGGAAWVTVTRHESGGWSVIMVGDDPTLLDNLLSLIAAADA